jgi:hypothetical protein
LKKFTVSMQEEACATGAPGSSLAYIAYPWKLQRISYTPVQSRFIKGMAFGRRNEI